MPSPNKTTYVTDERAIPTGTTDLTVRFGTLQNAKSALITNLDSSNDISCKLNDKANNSRTVEAGKSLILNDEYVTDIYLSNSSGASVNFSVMLIGG
jgi:hypothetical protein